MKSKRYLIALAAVLVLLSTGIALAATQQQFNDGNGNGQGGYGNGGGQGAYGNGGGQAAYGNGGADSALCTEDPGEALSYDGIPDGTLTPALESMLAAAIQDEFNAKAEYEALIAEFGAVRPFTNILSAEESHIDALTRIFEAYGAAVPQDNGAANAVVPGTLEEALQAGIDAEIRNIAMYERFLGEDLPDDVRTVFLSLMNASENHQAAFERRLDALS